MRPLTHIVFYDGECGFCDTSVRQIMSIDKSKTLRYAPLQGTTAVAALPASMRDPSELKTIVYLDREGALFTKSEAVIEILKRVGGFWKTFRIFRILPIGFRDWFYDRVAERRRSLIDKASCPLPTPDQQARILP